MTNLKDSLGKTFIKVESGQKLSEEELRKLENLTILLGCVTAIVKLRRFWYNENGATATPTRRFKKI